MRWLDDVPDHITARVVARCGTPHPFADLDPRRTALVVVDLQNAFMDDAVGHAVCPMARDIVPDVNRLAAAVRASGGGVFWIMNTFDARASAEWSVSHAMLTPAARARREAAMSEGSKGQELWPDLDVRPEDEIVRKYRFSAFLPGASDLPYRLRSRGFDTVLITGTVTNVCCEFIGPRRHDDELPHGDGDRCECRDDDGGASRLAPGVLRDLRRRDGHGLCDAAADAERCVVPWVTHSHSAGGASVD